MADLGLSKLLEEGGEMGAMSSAMDQGGSIQWQVAATLQRHVVLLAG